jgi:UDP-2,3-diacylglucosamine pyrophosphatase LpxH
VSTHLPPPERGRGLVVSDLHLFAPRSDGEACWKQIRPKLENCEVLVLNGDTFDFRWSTFPDHASTVRAALAWLTALLSQRPRREVHFVLGNHDCLGSFVRELPEVATAHPNFHWHDQGLQLGALLFIHGDCAQHRMDAAGWDTPRGGLASQAYLVADRLGLTWLAHRWAFPRRRTLARIAYYLDSARPDWRRTVRHCYFGHTHIPFADMVLDGITFHNTGSAVRGMAFCPVSFGLPSSEPAGG